ARESLELRHELVLHRAWPGQARVGAEREHPGDERIGLAGGDIDLDPAVATGSQDPRALPGGDRPPHDPRAELDPRSALGPAQAPGTRFELRRGVEAVRGR